MSILIGVEKVLQLFSEGAAELSFTDVSARLGLPRSSASRLLNQMQAYGLLEQDADTRRYRLGALVVRAVQASKPDTPLDVACRQVLEHLSEASGMTAYLSTLNGSETVVLQRLNGLHPVQVLSQPGSRRPALGTAMGRALLSRLKESELEAIYGRDLNAPLPPQGHDSPRTVGQLLARVRATREARFGIAVDEAMPGIGAVAAAVRDPASHELRGLCVSFLSSDADVATVEKVRALVVGHVGDLGRRLGDAFWLS